VRKSVSTALALGAAAALAATAVAAPAAAAPKNKGVTDVTILGGVFETLTEDLGFDIAPTGPGQVRVEDGNVVATFGITGKTGDAQIQHVGGLALTQDMTTATLSNFTIDLDSGFVSAVVNDSFRADVFAIGATTSNGVTLEITPGAAMILDGAFDFGPLEGALEGFALAYGAPMEKAANVK
jgi:hypothetical protein